MAEPSNRKLEIHLTSEERNELNQIVRKGSSPARKIQHARILLLCDSDHPDGQRTDAYAAHAVGVAERTVVRVRQQFVREGKSATLNRKCRSDPPVPPKVDGRVEAHIVTLCCSAPPNGRTRWTLRLMASELSRTCEVVLCPETIRQYLKKTNCSLGGRSGSALRKRIARGSSLRWRKSSMFTAKNTTKTNR